MTGWGRLLFAALGGVLALMNFEPVAAANDDPDPDACSLAASGEVQPLITMADVEIRPRSGNPAPGEKTCIWSAYQRGLTADAPPDASLSLAFYHFANLAKAEAEIRRIAKDALPPPGLVRTADPQDRIVRTDATTVFARHGVDIAVIDASEVQDIAHEKADWDYRIEALALQAAGAKVLGPVDDRATADTCHLVPAEHILALLTLSPSTLQPSLDGKRCFFSVKDGSGNYGAWVNNRGSAHLERENLGFNAAALKFQHDQTPFDPASNLVATTDPTDRVVLNTERPEEVWAVHGPYYVTLSLTDVTQAARAHPSWAYRVQRAALEAAGATIVPKPDITPDPVVPGPVVPRQADAPVAAAWTPPPHAAPANAGLIEPILHILAVLARIRFFVMPVFIGLPILISVRSSRARSGGTKSNLVWWVVPLGVGLGLINMLFGTVITTNLIYHYGVAGSATVTATSDSGSRSNSRPILNHSVLIRTPDRQVISTSFASDDFNVYPPHNRTTYPGKGEVFTVRYLSHFPRDFVIVADDGSPWASWMKCRNLRSAADDARQKRDFAPDQEEYRKAYDDAVRAEHDGGCDNDDGS